MRFKTSQFNVEWRHCLVDCAAIFTLFGLLASQNAIYRGNLKIQFIFDVKNFVIFVTYTWHRIIRANFFIYQSILDFPGKDWWLFPFELWDFVANLMRKFQIGMQNWDFAWFYYKFVGWKTNVKENSVDLMKWIMKMT